MIKSVVQVDAPKAQVFQALTDFARYPQWAPGCEECRVASAAGNVADVEMTMNSMRRMKLALRFESDPVHLIRFNLTKSADLKGYSGTYRLMDSADGKGTVVVAELEINAGMLAPKFIVDGVARKAITETGEALNGWVRKMQITAPKAAAARPSGKIKRGKRIARVVRTPAGYEVQILGGSFFVEHRK